jgi:hypothetical protein
MKFAVDRFDDGGIMRFHRVRTSVLATGLAIALSVLAVVPGLAASSTVTVTSGNMSGWFFWDDRFDTTASATGTLVTGPASPPLGVGSAQLKTPGASDGQALILASYQGTRLADITRLRYSTYRSSSDAGNLLAIALQFNIDYSPTDANAGFQGRLVFEPYQGAPANPVPQATWQTWDPQAGKWWASNTSAGGSGGLCPQSAPCTWAQVLSNWTDIRIHPTLGAIVFKAGSSWAGFDGNVDAFTIGVNGNEVTYNFEPTVGPPTNKDQCKNGGWQQFNTPAFKNQGDCVSYTNNGK